MMRLFAVPMVAAFAAAPAGAQAGPRTAVTDTATMIVRLGTDTLAVERWVRTPGRLDVVHIGRSPSVATRRYTLLFDDAGRPTHVSTATGDAAPQERTIDPVGAVPVFSSLFAPYAVMLEAARRSGAAQVDVPMLVGANARPVTVRRVDAATYTLPNQFGAELTARLDDRGRVLAIDAGGGSTVERVAPLSIDALAADWRARDARGEGLGPLSPRDTVSGDVAGARITVAYGRPAARGRPVMGNLVPYGEIWRTGANDETLLMIRQPVELGTLRLEPGTYSVFTIPGEQAWELIVNRQTGQGGLAHDPAHDVGRAQMQVQPLAEPVERFTIEVREQPDGTGLLVMSWERVAASVPIRVPAR